MNSQKYVNAVSLSNQITDMKQMNEKHPVYACQMHALTAFMLTVQEEGERKQKHKKQYARADRTTGDNSHWDNI